MFASRIACRNYPAPESLVLVIVIVSASKYEESNKENIKNTKIYLNIDSTSNKITIDNVIYISALEWPPY